MQTSASKHRILVVDDNVDAAATLAVLIRLLGHEVRIAQDGKTAIDLARSMRPDFLFLDGLPGMDGFEVAEILRREPSLAAMRIIAVTGYGSEQDRLRARHAGCDLHMIKPVDADFVRSLLGDARGSDAS